MGTGCPSGLRNGGVSINTPHPRTAATSSLVTRFVVALRLTSIKHVMDTRPADLDACLFSQRRQRHVDSRPQTLVYEVGNCSIEKSCGQPGSTRRCLWAPAVIFMTLIRPMALVPRLIYTTVGGYEIQVERAALDVVDVSCMGCSASGQHRLGDGGVWYRFRCPNALVEYRQHGVFRRYRVTPMPSYMRIMAPLFGWRSGHRTRRWPSPQPSPVQREIWCSTCQFAGNFVMVMFAILVSYMFVRGDWGRFETCTRTSGGSRSHWTGYGCLVFGSNVCSQRPRFRPRETSP